jgi:hypothetical protein
MSEAWVPEILELGGMFRVWDYFQFNREYCRLRKLLKAKQLRPVEKVSAGVRNGGCEPEGTRLGVAQTLPSSPA